MENIKLLENEIMQIEAEELVNHIGEIVKIHGSIYKIRRMSDFAFVLLRTKRSVVQGIYSVEYSEFTLESLVEESAVIFTAKVVAEERSRVGYELQLMQMEVLSVPTESSPIVINQKKLAIELMMKKKSEDLNILIYISLIIHMNDHFLIFLISFSLYRILLKLLLCQSHYYLFFLLQLYKMHHLQGHFHMLFLYL